MTGPDPAGQAPWAHLGHRQRPRGISSPDGCPMGSALCGKPVGHSAHLPPHPSRWTGGRASGTVLEYNSRGGDWLRLRWLIQGKRVEDGGHNLVNTVTAKR